MDIRALLTLPFALLLFLAHPAEPGAAASTVIRIPLGTLSLAAESVVLGRITRQRAASFEMAVERTLAGKSLPSRVRIAHRASVEGETLGRCRVGDTCVAFLGTPWWDTKELPFVLGGAMQGLMRVEGAAVRLGYCLDGERDPILGKYREGGSGVPVSELERVLRELRELVDWSPSRTHDWIQCVQSRKSIEELETFAQSSLLARQVCSDLRSLESWNGPRLPRPQRIDPRELRALDLESARGAALWPGAGTCIVPIGDLDGDGECDLACSFLALQANTDDGGALWFALLAPDGTVRDLIRPELREPVPGLAPELERVISLAVLPDLDGDGIAELALGTSCEQRPHPAGNVWIVFLDRKAGIRCASDITPRTIQSLSDSIPSTGLGRAVLSLASAAPGGRCEIEVAVETRPRDDVREWFALPLQVDPSGRITRGTPTLSSLGMRITETWRAGQTWIDVGDVQGDGCRDTAVGCPFDDWWGRGGAVYLQLRKIPARYDDPRWISSGLDGFFEKLGRGERFGQALCAPGDLDGNGVPDLLVGSASGVWTLFLARDGTVERIVELEDGPSDTEDAVHFGDSLTALPQRSPDEPVSILCGGTRGAGEHAQAVIWRLALGSDGVLRPR